MKHIYKFSILLLFMAVMTCCSEDKANRNMGNVVSSSDVSVDIKTDPTDPNLVHFKLLTPDCQALFECPEADIKLSDSEFSKRIVWRGDYTIKITVYNKAGYSEPVMKSFTIPSTASEICGNIDYSLLTGGCENPTGKTWRLDMIDGAIGNGAAGADHNDQWAPTVADLIDKNLFDDDLTFILERGQQAVLKNNGGSYMNKDCSKLFSDGSTTDSFITTKYTPASNASWSISTDTYGVKWLQLSGVIPCYGVDESMVKNATKYKIFELTQTSLHIAYIKSDISWHYYFTSTPRP